MKSTRIPHLLMLLLFVIVVVAGCSPQSVGEEAQNDSSQTSHPSSSVVDAGAQPESTPSPVTEQGEVARVSEAAFELRREDGSSFTVLLTEETQITGDPLGDGSRAYVTHAGPDKGSGTVVALAVKVIAVEEEEATPSASPSPDSGAPTPETLLTSMTLEEKVGQLFFARVPGEDAPADAAQYQFGGYLLFGRDFKGLTKEQVQQKIQSYQDSVKIPMLIGVDEEGGTVVRVSANPNLRETPYESPRALYDAGGLDLVAEVEREKIRCCKAWGSR